MAQPWQPAIFTAIAAFFPPLLAPANQMTYDTQQFYNTALAIIPGSGAAALTDGVGHSACRLALHGSGLELLRHGAENSIRLLPRLVMRKPLEVTLDLLRLSLMTQSGALMFELRKAAEQAITPVQGAVVAYAPPFTRPAWPPHGSSGGWG